jgi:hypothetical protein
MDVLACPLRHQWDLTTRTPHRLFEALKSLAETLGYKVDVSDPFQMEQSSISEAATVTARFSAERQVTERYNKAQGALGALSLAVALAFLALGSMGTIEWPNVMLIVVGLVLVLVGAAAVATGFQSRKQFLFVTIQGSARRAGGRRARSPDTSDMVADIRVAAGTSTALFAGGTEIEGGLAPPPADLLVKDFSEFRRTLESMLPEYVSP